MLARLDGRRYAPQCGACCASAATSTNNPAGYVIPRFYAFQIIHFFSSGARERDTMTVVPSERRTL